MITRRGLLKGSVATAAMAGVPGVGTLSRGFAARASTGVDLRPISGGAERIPAVGLGSWITFNVGNDPKALNASTAVVDAFFKAGGRMIDSSPMYGSAQNTIGYALKKLGMPDGVFAADKVWTRGAERGRSQMTTTKRLWGVPKIDLMQIHNLLDWQAHLETLRDMKARGDIRYIGITTSHGRRHGDLEKILQREDIDFVQLTYNIEDREVERRLLPVAQERGVAVIVNRPFQRGGLIRKTARQPLPAWAGEAGAANWAQFLLKFAISHPAVTCAIPATTRVDHVTENMKVASGTMPDEKLRARMAAYYRDL